MAFELSVYKLKSFIECNFLTVPHTYGSILLYKDMYLVCNNR